MYCSTCGSRVPEGRASCDTCGTRLSAETRPVARGAGRTLASAVHERLPAVAVGLCPRCGYRGEGVGYFSRGLHLAGLIAATMFTSWAMGAGGLVYFLMRRHDRICPRCHAGWGRFSELAVAVSGSRPTNPSTAPSMAPPERSPKEGWAVLLFILAAILAISAIVGGNPGALALSGAAAGGGLLLHRAAEGDREARRNALIASLQLPVLRLASDRGGRLTVSEVAAELGWTLPRAEKVLQSLDDGFRVSSEVTDDGLIVYEFRELVHGPRRLPELDG